MMAMPSENSAATEKLYVNPTTGLSVATRGKEWSLRDREGAEIARGTGSESLVAALAPLRRSST
jgi:hypothetical protein